MPVVKHPALRDRSGPRYVVRQSNRPLAFRRPWMYPKQLAAVWSPTRYSIVEASTKSGKTHACIAWITEKAMTGAGNGRNYWWVAPIFAQGKIAYRRLRRALVKSPWAFKSNETELTITLLNGAVITFKSAEHPDSLYGEDVYACVIDEATRVKEESWFAIRSTITKTRGPVRLIGNVKGRKNWVYQMARKAESGEPNMEYHRITAWDAVDAGILDGEEIEAARRELPERVFRELYLTEPSDDGGNPFGIEHISHCIVDRLSDDPPTAFGIDLAKHIDFTTILGLDNEGYLAHYQRFQTAWRETVRRISLAVGEYAALVDATGVGDPILEQLQFVDGRDTDPRPNFNGYTFTQPSKQRLMEGLAVAIQSEVVHYPREINGDPCALVAELEAFEFEYTMRGGVRYAAPQGMHDDTVMGLALAVEQMAHVPEQWRIV